MVHSLTFIIRYMDSVKYKPFWREADSCKFSRAFYPEKNEFLSSEMRSLREHPVVSAHTVIKSRSSVMRDSHARMTKQSGLPRRTRSQMLQALGSNSTQMSDANANQMQALRFLLLKVNIFHINLCAESCRETGIRNHLRN